MEKRNTPTLKNTREDNKTKRKRTTDITPHPPPPKGGKIQHLGNS